MFPWCSGASSLGGLCLACWAHGGVSVPTPVAALVCRRSANVSARPACGSPAVRPTDRSQPPLRPTVRTTRPVDRPTGRPPARATDGVTAPPERWSDRPSDRPPDRPARPCRRDPEHPPARQHGSSALEPTTADDDDRQTTTEHRPPTTDDEDRTEQVEDSQMRPRRALAFRAATAAKTVGRATFGARSLGMSPRPCSRESRGTGRRSPQWRRPTCWDAAAPNPSSNTARRASRGGQAIPRGDAALVARVRATSRRFSAVSNALAWPHGAPARPGQGGVCFVRALVVGIVSSRGFALADGSNRSLSSEFGSAFLGSTREAPAPWKPLMGGVGHQGVARKQYQHSACTSISTSTSTVPMHYRCSTSAEDEMAAKLWDDVERVLRGGASGHNVGRNVFDELLATKGQR